ncbi:MAG: lamin tail domain-containing protein [Cyclobacteriaceae bacterium]
MTRIIKMLFLVTTNALFAQVNDPFDDGNFSSNPNWTGDVSEFAVDDANRLRLNNLSPSTSNESYLSLPSVVLEDAVWEFKVGFDGLSGGSSGGLSRTNKMFVYLVSDKADLETDPNGYYVLIGNSNDEISLYSTSSSTAIIDGADDVTQFSSAFISIRVTRDVIGNWELLIDTEGGSAFSSQGTATNNDFVSSSFFGVLCHYTTSRSTNFFFDDFDVTGLIAEDMDPPEIQSVSAISDTEVDLIFSENVEEVTAETNMNYTINGGITVLSASRDVFNHALVHLITSSMVNGTSYLMEISNITDENENAISSGSQAAFQYLVFEEADVFDVVVNEFMAKPLNEGGTTNGEFVELLNNSSKYFDLKDWTFSDASGSSSGFPSLVFGPGEFLILAPSSNPEIFAGLGKVLVVSGFRTLNDTSDDILIKDDDGTAIFNLSYSTPELGKSEELVNPDDPCISELSYLRSTAESGSTPGSVNSVFDNTADTTNPEIISYNFDGSLTLNFSETMDAFSLVNGGYEVQNLTISNVSVGLLPSSVNIFFSEPLQAGVIYELLLTEISDCWGNELTESRINFGIGRTPTFNEILITEILSDPDPSAGLPEVEFVEIYNNTSELLSTEGLEFSDHSSTAFLPSITLSPFDYYVLTANSNISKFQTTKIIGVSNMPSLRNSGEQLYLSKGQDLIFSVSYSNDWHDEEKSDGGFSLEMKDLNHPCVEEFNWESSANSSGGTPGFPNSSVETIPDNFGPEITKIIASSKREILITFNENIDPNATLGSVLFEPELSIAAIDFNYLYPKSIFVTLNEDLVESRPHTAKVSNIYDCNGNETQESQLVLAFPSAAVVGDLLLSEVLFDPRTNGVDFVEVYNSSDKYLNLEQWKFARITDSGVTDKEEISEHDMIIGPGDYFAFSTDSEVLYDNYPKGNKDNFRAVNALPTYANDSGNVILLNHLGELHQLFHYDEDFHYNLLESTDGVSLERISFTTETNDPNNWRSASSIVGFATPGLPNSQTISELRIAVGTVEVEPKVFVPGNSGSGRDFTTINYQFAQPGKFANITIYDQGGRLIKNVATGALLPTSGFMRWDGTTNSGELARLGYYVILFEVYDSSGNSDFFKETVVVGRDF